MIPGELFIKDGEIELNAGRKTVTLTVANTGDRPIQVGSHYHFFETNPALKFDRKKARGMRLDIAAGTAVRFEPGQTRDVQLVALAGKRVDLRFSRRRAWGSCEPDRRRSFSGIAGTAGMARRGVATSRISIISPRSRAFSRTRPMARMPSLVAAGWLHDTIEDTGDHARGASQRFGGARRRDGRRGDRRHVCLPKSSAPAEADRRRA